MGDNIAGSWGRGKIWGTSCPLPARDRVDVMQMRLTAALVRQLTGASPPAKDTSIFDMTLARFYLRLKPSGAASYGVRYVGPDGREHRYRVGSPVTMDLDEARKAARAVLRRVDEGGDPAADKA